MECFSICLCHLWFLWSAVFSSPRRGPSLILLAVFLGILFFLWQLWMGLPFWFGSQFDCCWCIETLVTFLHWFYSWKLSWSCLSAEGAFELRLWGFLIQNNVICKERLPLFLFGCHLFLSLAQLLWLVLPILCWIRMVRVDILFWFRLSRIILFILSKNLLLVSLIFFYDFFHLHFVQ